MLIKFTMTRSGSAVLNAPRPVEAEAKPVKFDAEFLERRMAEHRATLERTSGIFFLPTPIEEMRFCARCQSVQIFVADRDCAFGLVGTCKGCGEDWLRPFTRTHSGMA